MKVFTCTNHAGHYPVPVASVIVAATEAQARDLLDEALASRRLWSGPYTLTEVSTRKPAAHVLSDGEY